MALQAKPAKIADSSSDLSMGVKKAELMSLQ